MYLQHTIAIMRDNEFHLDISLFLFWIIKKKGRAKKKKKKRRKKKKKKRKKIIETFVKFHRRFFFVIITFAKREKETIAQRSSSAYIKNLNISKKPSRSLEEINDDDIRLRLHTQKYLRNRLLRNLRPHVLRVSALVQVP